MVTLVRSFYPAVIALNLIAIAIEVRTGHFGPQAPLDDPTHFCFPAAAGSVLCRELFPDSHRRLRPRQAYLTVMACGIMTESLWETVEYGLDLGWGLQWQIDNTDTMGDIITGLIGSQFGAASHTLFDYLLRREGY